MMTNMKKILTVITTALIIVSQASVFTEAQPQIVADTLFEILENTRDEVNILFDDVSI